MTVSRVFGIAITSGLVLQRSDELIVPVPTLEIAIKILVAAKQQQDARLRVPLVGEQHLLAVERKLVDVDAGQIAFFRLTYFRVVDDRAHRVFHYRLLAGGEFLVHPLERGHLQNGDVRHACEWRARRERFSSPPSTETVPPARDRCVC